MTSAAGDDAQFEQRKRSGMEAISVCELDKSPKGSVDQPILHLVHLINSHSDYCTTSSCSGRISLFHTNGEQQTCKGRGFWLLALHREVSEEDGELERSLTEGLQQQQQQQSEASITLFKHEPFVLHVLCRTVAAAQAMLLCAREAGFRESGLSVSNADKIILAVRTTSNVLEVPVAVNGQPLCQPAYLAFLAQQANLKFRENVRRVDHFYGALQALFLSSPSVVAVAQAARPTVPTQWKPMEDASFKRWGHVAVVLDAGRVLLFGGWKENARTNETSIWEATSAFRLVTTTATPQPAPPALVYHTGTLVTADTVLVFGGRTSPQSPSNELWRFRVSTESWEQVVPPPSSSSAAAAWPAARFRHAACSAAANGSLYVFGGRDADGLALGDLWEFTPQGEWIELSSQSLDDGPGRVFAHAMVANEDGGKLYVHGGLRNETVECKDGRIFCFDLASKTWSVAAAAGVVPWRFSHHWVNDFASPSETYMCGGVLDECSASVLGLEEALHIRLGGGDEVHVEPPLKFTLGCELLAVQHSLAVLGGRDKMVVFGGGATCFAFGSVYSPSAQLTVQAGGAQEAPLMAVAAKETEHFFKCAKASAVTVKKLLEEHGALDKARKVEHAEGGALCFPVHPSSSPAAATALVDLGDFIQLAPKQAKGAAATTKHQQAQQHQAELAALSQRLFGSKDVKVERVDDVLLVPAARAPSASANAAAPITSEDWQQLLVLHPGAQRIVQRERVDSGVMRQSRNRLLFSSTSSADLQQQPHQHECWVSKTENGVTFSWDMLQVMYSKGNVSEKLRFAQLVRPGETVLDLFAGIGYFTVPALKLAQPSKVYSCELNKHSVRALRRNIAINGIDPSRSLIFPGDCRHFTKENFADRISLGLLPDARVGFVVACRAIVNGGWMHIHENVNESDVEAWGVAVAGEITNLLNSVRPPEEGEWTATCEFISRVKSYAPRVLHVVGDVKCERVATAAAAGAAEPTAGAATAPATTTVGAAFRPLPRSPAMQELAGQLRLVADSLLCDTATPIKETLTLAADAELLFKRLGATLRERSENDDDAAVDDDEDDEDDNNV